MKNYSRKIGNQNLNNDGCSLAYAYRFLGQIIILDGKIFNANVNTTISNLYLSKKNKLKFEKAILDNYDDLKINEIGELDYEYFNTEDSLFIPPLNKEAALLMELIESKKLKKLKSISTINFGMQLRDRKKYPMDVIQNPDKSLLTVFHKKCYTGKDIKAFKLKYSNRYCYYNREAKKGGCWNDDAQLAKNKILVPQIGKFPVGAIDRKGYPVLNTAFMINLFSPELSENILAQLNSEVISFVWLNKFRDDRDTFPKIKGSYLGELPVILNQNNCFNILVHYLENLTDNINSNQQNSFFKSVLNAAVYELYFPEEFKSAGKEILKHLNDLKPITDDMSDEEKLAIIQSEFERLYDTNHPVRFALETIDSIEEVRIIKEALS